MDTQGTPEPQLADEVRELRSVILRLEQSVKHVRINTGWIGVLLFLLLVVVMFQACCGNFACFYSPAI
jgi:hypothetical protein